MELTEKMVAYGRELFARHPELGWLHMGPHGWHEVPEGFVKVHEEIAKRSREVKA